MSSAGVVRESTNGQVKPKLLQHIELPFLLTDGLADDFEVVDWRALSDSEFAQVAGDFEILLSSGEDKVSAEFIDRLPNLKLIANFGVGYDGIDLAAAAKRGIKVSNTPGVVTDDVADLAVGFLIALSRDLRGCGRYAESGGWSNGPYKWTHKVAHSKVGIFGLGRIGSALATRLVGFGVEVHYCDLVEREDSGFVYHESILDLARAVDSLIISAPGGSDTDHLVDATVLDALGSEGRLINTARGSLVDQEALIEALDAGRLGGAALDVLADEPNVPSGLIGRDNVVVTPHIGTATWETRQEMSSLVIENIKSWLADGSLVTPVI